MMHSLMQVSVKSAVFGRFCFAHAYRDLIVKRTARGTLILNTLYIHGGKGTRRKEPGDVGVEGRREAENGAYDGVRGDRVGRNWRRRLCPGFQPDGS